MVFIASTHTGTDMADVNVANKKFTAHACVGNLRMDVCEFTIPSGASGGVLETRLSRILAADICSQDAQRRNQEFVIVGGAIAFGALSGGAGDNGRKMIAEVWGW